MIAATLVNSNSAAPAKRAMQLWRDGALPIETILAIFAIEAGIEVQL